MEIPVKVREAVKEAVEKHEDLEKAVRVALSAISRMPKFQEYVDALIHRGVADLVYGYRKKLNQACKQQNGAGSIIKVRSWESEAVQKAHRSVYLYFISGTVLGNLYGRDLAAKSEGERNTSNAHLFNATILERLAKIVPADKMVREAVSENKLAKLFKDIGKTFEKDAT